MSDTTEKTKYKFSKRTLTAARDAWNELSEIFEEDPIIYQTDEEFVVFYKQLCRELENAEIE